MKKVICLSISLLILNYSMNAQDNSLHIKTGMMLAPMASMSLENPKDGFSAIVPLFAVTSFTKGKTTVVPSYCFNLNSVNLFITRDLTPKLSPYVVNMKSVKTKWGYTGVGITTPVVTNVADVFIEIGSDWVKLNPTLYTGIYIPFKFKVW
jgi:hypothetical protein